VGNLLSGLLGTLPSTTSPSSVAIAEVTGVAARRVGAVIGAALLALAFLPKLTAVLIAIPPAVAAAYIVVLLGLLFVQGMQLVLRNGLDHRTAAWRGSHSGWGWPSITAGSSPA